MDFQRFRGQDAWRPVASCGGLCRPEKCYFSGLDPFNIKISDSGGLGLEAWMPGCWQDWRGLEEVTARWEEGIGRNSHTLELQELGGFLVVCHVRLWAGTSEAL